MQRLETSMEEIRQILRQTALQQAQTQRQLDSLAIRQENFQNRLEKTHEGVVALEPMIRTLAVEGQRDREDIRAMQAEVRGLQLENRRILDVLLNQQGENG